MTRPLRRIMLAAGLATTSLLAIGPGSASGAAEVVRIGSPLTNPPTGAICSNCVGTWLGQPVVDTPLPLASPVNGTVTSWSVRAYETGALYTLRILRPVSANSFMSVGASNGTVVPAPGATNYTYPTSLPIQTGDRIGVLPGGTASGLPDYSTNNPGDVIAYSGANFADQTTQPFTLLGGHEILIQATIQFCRVPNVVGQTTAAAQTALTAAGCGVKVTKKPKKKKKKRGKVLRMGTAAGTTVGLGNPIEIYVGKKPKKK